jgi:hypothetical protein
VLERKAMAEKAMAFLPEQDFNKPICHAMKHNYRNSNLTDSIRKSPLHLAIHYM